MNNCSKLGIGTIRFPQIENGILDLPNIYKIIQECERLGISFVDTSYAYFGGQCEVALGLALKNSREKWEISTRFNPVGKNKGDLFKHLIEQLNRLKTSYIDYYGFHGINKSIFDEIIIPFGFLDELKSAKKEKLVKNIGFSFHDIPENMIYIIEEANIFDYVICQYNFMKSENKNVLEYAKKKGLITIIMGPFCGGKVKVTSDILEMCQCSSSIELALRYVMANENIDIILSGVQNVEELVQNINIIKDEKFINLSLIDALVKDGRIDQNYYCTGCGYCLPCPNNINIPEIFNVANGTIEMKKDEANINYLCIGCGICEARCPQKLEIRNVIKSINENKLVPIY